MEAEETPKTLIELQEENQRLRRALEELSILNQIGSVISSTMSLNGIVELIVQESVTQLNVEQGAVMLLQDMTEGDPFRTMARKAYEGSDIVPFRFGQQLTGWMLKNQKPLLINNFQEDDQLGAVVTGDFAPSCGRDHLPSCLVLLAALRRGD